MMPSVYPVVFAGIALTLCGAGQLSAQPPQISGRSSGNQSAAISPTSGVRDEWFRIEFDGRSVGYESLINIRSRQNNPSLELLDTDLRQRVQEIAVRLLGNL